jgi:hypothetical protein
MVFTEELNRCGSGCLADSWNDRREQLRLRGPKSFDDPLRDGEAGMTVRRELRPTGVTTLPTAVQKIEGVLPARRIIKRRTLLRSFEPFL